jgi:ribonuclease PH
MTVNVDVEVIILDKPKHMEQESNTKENAEVTNAPFSVTERTKHWGEPQKKESIGSD